MDVTIMKCADHQADEKKLPYLRWHAKAAQSAKKGLKQQQCSECRRYYWPWEMRQ